MSLVTAVLISSQILISGSRVTLWFTPSLDHETVSYYEVDVVLAEGDKVLSTVNIGKPILRSNGDIRVRLGLGFIPRGITCYFVARAIRGVESSGNSDPSEYWQRIVK